MSKAWKYAENYFADIYKKYKIPARRETRAGDWSVKDFEVKIEGHPEIVGDSKYSQARPFRHHGLVQEAEAKYCKTDDSFAVILTKNYKERGGCITVRDEVFAMLLAYWLGCASKEDLMKIYLGEE